jgi:hypothetical protein
MRACSIVILLAAACGGAAKATPPQQPSNQGSGDGAPASGGADKAACANRSDEFGPFTLDAAQAKQRYGVGAHSYAATPTTKEHAIEVCGVTASLAWLMAATCDNGQPAFRNMGDAHDSRSGSVGGGGRCGAIIDLYVAKCPEREYQVFIDMYMCGPGDKFME